MTTPPADRPGPGPAPLFAGGGNRMNADEQLIAEIQRLNANLEVLLSASQGQLLAELVDVLRDLRQMAARTLGYTISGDDD